MAARNHPDDGDASLCGLFPAPASSAPQSGLRSASGTNWQPRANVRWFSKRFVYLSFMNWAWNENFHSRLAKSLTRWPKICDSLSLLVNVWFWDAFQYTPRNNRPTNLPYKRWRDAADYFNEYHYQRINSYRLHCQDFKEAETSQLWSRQFESKKWQAAGKYYQIFVPVLLSGMIIEATLSSHPD